MEAPVQEVWTLLQDIPRVSECLPGVEALEEADPDVYRGRLKVKIGPLAAGFGGQVTIVEREPRRLIVAQIEAEDRSSASFVRATFTSRLTSVEAGTQIEYEMDMALRGRLAQFGSAVVGATAKKLTSQFARCLQEVLSR